MATIRASNPTISIDTRDVKLTLADTYEIVEIAPNVLQGRKNGKPIDGARSCHRPTGAYVELRVVGNSGAIITPDTDGRGMDSRPVVASHYVQGHTAGFDCIQEATIITDEEQTHDMELFEYAVTYTPRDDAGNVIQDEVKILTQTTLVLAKHQGTVGKQAIADLSDKTLNLDYVNVEVRAFAYGRPF